MGIISSVSESAQLAASISDNEGCYFVPAFAGLGAPWWDPHARGIVCGLTGASSRATIVRAACESMAYQSYDVLRAMEQDVGLSIERLSVDGGASRNEFIMQFQADLLDIPVLQCETVETTAIGAAYLAGLAVGYWEDLEELEQNAQIVRSLPSPHVRRAPRATTLRAGVMPSSVRSAPHSRAAMGCSIQQTAKLMHGARRQRRQRALSARPSSGRNERGNQSMTVTYDTSRVTLVDHPLVQHKLSILRDKNTGTNQFRQLVRELALFDGYEAMRDLPMEDVEVETPITTATFKQLAGKKLAIVPILRAGLGMVDGILDLVPSARVGHIGMERDEVTHEPHEYYCKMPKDIDQRICLVVDPMLATGGSAEMAISYLRERGVKDIRMLCIVAAPEGLKSLTEKDPDVHIYTCAIDDHLNEAAYIVPGLGDAGDRIYGTL